MDLTKPTGLHEAKLAIYVSPNDAPDCYDLAVLYADAYQDGRALCNADYMETELRHYTSNEYAESVSSTELELIGVLRYLRSQEIEWLMVCEQ